MTACAATLPRKAIGGSRVILLLVLSQIVRIGNFDPQRCPWGAEDRGEDRRWGGFYTPSPCWLRQKLAFTGSSSGKSPRPPNLTVSVSVSSLGDVQLE